MRIIDAHVHVLDDYRPIAPFQDTGRADRLLALMDECGVEKAIMLPVVADFSPDNNRECADLVGRHPDRLAMLADVPMHEPDAAARVLTAPLDRVVGVGAVRELDPLEHAHRLDGGPGEVLIILQGPGAGQPHETPCALRRNLLVEDGVAQVGASVLQARCPEGLAVRRFQLIPRLPHELRQGVGAGPAVNHAVRAVERVVPSGSEGVAGAVRLVDEVGHEASGLLHRHSEELLPVRVRIVRAQSERQADHSGVLSGVLDPVLGAHDPPLAVPHGEQPGQGSPQGFEDCRRDQHDG